MKVAVLSMDTEDWYHLDYFHGMRCDKSYSLLDGISNYCEVLAEHDIKSTFFVLSEIAYATKTLLSDIVKQGHDISVHGWGHTRPLVMSTDEFREDLDRSRKALEDILGISVQGYRAPCFSLDRKRLDLVREAGFKYDSSYLPLYGKMNLSDFCEPVPGVYRLGDFCEFEISSLSLAGKNIPVAGGGYLRIFPWVLMRSLIKAYLKKHSIYTLYIHPFELSSRTDVPLPSEVGRATRMRFSLGRKSTKRKLFKLICLLKSEGFRFKTFRDLRDEILTQGVNDASCK